ncbi:hypothetical protein E2C01_022128 [Portunus trituberculatus]|uniref:Uncharacterized protein n=1 Tax=Portunus trituberculatus TaxID=210409 RepID=A0A5B7E6G0_PORTR|nr:hypothetical protein [Portunus trituberculatus]
MESLLLTVDAHKADVTRAHWFPTGSALVSCLPVCSPGTQCASNHGSSALCYHYGVLVNGLADILGVLHNLCSAYSLIRAAANSCIYVCLANFEAPVFY